MLSHASCRLSSITICCAALILSGVAYAQAPSPNLMQNSSFEFGPKSGGQPTSWEFPNVPPGGDLVRDLTVAHSGKASVRLSVPDATTLSWYQASQDCTVHRAGEKFTLSVYIKAKGIHDGAGAYCSIGFYDANNKRLTYSDADPKVSGTGDWVRQQTTGTVPEGTTTLRVILTLYGHGTAWFDDVQLETGEATTAYQPSLADVDVEARQVAELAAARAYRSAHKMARHPGLDVAVLKDNIPATGAGSSPDVLAAALGKGGFVPQFVTGDDIANEALLSTDNFDLLVLPYGASFPTKATTALQGFLSSGGSFLSTGGYAFDAPLVNVKGKWYDQTRLPEARGGKSTTIFNFEGADGLKGWGTGSYQKGTPKLELLSEGAPEGQQYVRAATESLLRWDTVASNDLPAGKLPAGWSVTVFRAKGDANTRKLAVEWHERDFSRWKTVIDLTPEWQEYRIPHTSLSYWQDNPSVGRGGPTDHFRPANAAGMMFGIAEDIAKTGGKYSYCIDDIRVEDDPLYAERMSAVQINTRIGPIRDALFPAASQIGAFSPSDTLEQVAYARTLGDQKIITDSFRLPGSFAGYAGTAMLGLNGHGFGPDRMRLIPLLTCCDRFGRERGALGSVAHNYTGLYQGSSWAFFGVTNADLFSAARPQMLAALPQVARAVTRKFYLHGTEAEYACYRQGERIKLLAEVSNFGPALQRGKVVLEVRRGGAKDPTFATTLPVTVKPGDTAKLETMWKPPSRPDDMYYIRATLVENAAGTAAPREVDREYNAVVIWDDAVVKAGLAPKIQDTYFQIAGKPLFMVGNQNWWGQVGSVSARSPLKLERDYAMMQDQGLRFSRCFLGWHDEREKRMSDAWVYLAQKHKIVLFHTPNLFNSMEDKVQAEQEKWAREIGERYKDVPGLVVDISNEPYFTLNSDPNATPPFNAYLKAKYGTDEAIKAAWPMSPPEKPMPEVPCADPSEKWGDRRASDTYAFAMQRQYDWARLLKAQFKAGDPEMPISVGYMQGFGWRGAVWDALNNSLDLDFTDRHYYGELSVVPAEIKEIDLRWMGKPMTIGECGAKCHPSFDNGNMGEDGETFARRFLYMGHSTFGMGGAFLASWHWRDPMEGIFPCGIVRSDQVPRLACAAMRNMAITFSCVHPKYEPPQVFVLLPDVHRMSAQRDQVTRGVRRAIDLLLGLRVRFETISEKSLAQLPPTAQAIVYPIPYALTDATYGALKAFVSRGGKLYLSGDISYDETFQRTKTDRLKELCGVEFVGENYPNIALEKGRASSIAPLTNAMDLPRFEGHPGLKLKPAGGEVLAEDAGQSPVIVTNKVGSGGVFFLADPIELEAADAVPQRKLFEYFLNWAKIPREAMTPDSEAVHAYTMKTEEGGSIRVFQNTGTETTVKLDEAQGKPELGLGAGLPGLLWQDKAGGVLAVEGQGVLRVGDKQVASLRGQFTVLSLDDAPLDKSQALLILPFTGGSVELASAARTGPVVAEFGEVVQGSWKTLEAAQVRVSGGKLAVSVPAEHRNSLLLVAARGSFDTYSGALAARVARR